MNQRMQTNMQYNPNRLTSLDLSDYQGTRNPKEQTFELQKEIADMNPFLRGIHNLAAGFMGYDRDEKGQITPTGLAMMKDATQKSKEAYEKGQEQRNKDIDRANMRTNIQGVGTPLDPCPEGYVYNEESQKCEPVETETDNMTFTKNPMGLQQYMNQFATGDQSTVPLTQYGRVGGEYDFFLNQSNAKFLEFHLSYKDLSYDIEKLFKNCKYDIDLTVHAPDLFEHDHLIDLSSDNQEYRTQSVNNLKRVIDITKKLRPYFSVDSKTKIISSLGGFTRNEWMSESDKKQAYKRVAESLKQLTDDETEIIIQTVPPFPWYFGGQLLLNLFAHPDEIVSFCKDNNYKICFDTSHSKLFCNHFKYDMYTFVEKVRDYVSHVHVSDALDVDKEGLQIGEGDIDFNHLLKTIPLKATIMPEIWQGHKNFGEACWIALNKIESITKGAIYERH